MIENERAIKLCGIYENEKMYNDYHRLYDRLKTCANKPSAEYYQAFREKKY